MAREMQFGALLWVFYAAGALIFDMRIHILFDMLTKIPQD